MIIRIPGVDKHVLSLLTSVTGKPKTMPILNSMLIEVRGGQARLCTTDLDTTIIAEVPATADEDVALCMDARLLANVLGMGDATIDAGETQCQIINGAYKVSLPLVDPERYPRIPEVEKGKEIELNAHQFAALVNRAAPYVEKHGRYGPQAISGIRVIVEAGRLAATATDGKWVYHEVINVDGEETERAVDVAALVAAAAIVSRLTANDTVGLTLEANRFSVHAPGVTVFGRTLEGRYPDTSKAVPDETAMISRTIKRTALAEAVSLALRTAHPDTQLVTLRAGARHEVSSEDKERNVSTKIELKPEAITASCSSESVVGYNGRRLLKALSTLGSEKIRLVLNEGKNHKPTMLHPTDSTDRWVLLMPLRIN